MVTDLNSKVALSGQAKSKLERDRKKTFDSAKKGGLALLSALKKLKKEVPEGTNIDWTQVFQSLSSQANYDAEIAKDIETWLSGSGSSEIESFVLESGKEVKFVRQTFTPEMLDELVVVDEAVNGREQAYLNTQSTEDIAQTLSNGQWLPCIAVPSTLEEGKFEFLDGSRRKFVAIKKRIPLKTLVALDSIDKEDARFIARSIQHSNKAHSPRERGRDFLQRLEDGSTAEQIQAAEGIAQSSFYNAIAAASVHEKFLKYVRDLNDVGIREWKKLASLTKKFAKQQIDIEEFMESIAKDESISSLLNSAEAGNEKEDQKKLLLKVIELAQEKATPIDSKKANKEKTKEIGMYSSKSFLRASTDLKNYNISFGEVSQECSEEMEAAIMEIWKRHYSK